MAAVIATRDISLHSWQNAAVNAWISGDEKGRYRGTLEIFTGGGKTLIALECLGRASKLCSDLRLAVVVPTEALVDQWTDVLLKSTSLSPRDIGRLGAGGDDDFTNKRCLVCVINTAARKLPDLASDPDSLMLVVDECHRAGAHTFSRVLNTRAKYRLGLSATPDREELDEDGVPIEFDEQLVGQLLGSVVYRFSLRDARNIGWLPSYEIHHHGVELLADERLRYDEETRRIDDLGDKLTHYGIDPSAARRASSRTDEGGAVARAYVAATSNRKGMLYKAVERDRVASLIVADLVRRKPGARILLFHERVDKAVDLYSRLTHLLPSAQCALEHSKLSVEERRKALRDFRVGSASILVSVKSLVEGIDVPDADVGVSVASSSSVRQRVQSLGRVLRRTFDVNMPAKVAEMHIVYVAKTVDDAIYGKEDWSDLTGVNANHYWRWLAEANEPAPEVGPPRRPFPTEEQEHERLDAVPQQWPQLWQGAIPASEYSVDSLGNVTTPFGRIVANAQTVDRMVASVRGRPGGRFYVTPVFRYVIVRDGEGNNFAAGRLTEPFVARDLSALVTSQVASEVSQPGKAFHGPLDKSNGSYKLSQKRGGVIERRNVANRSSEYALVTGGGQPELEANARRILESWRRVTQQGMQFHLNADWHAWYLEGGEAKYLGQAIGGFAWPAKESNEEL